MTAMNVIFLIRADSRATKTSANGSSTDCGEGGLVLNEEVLWKAKSGDTVPVLVSYSQVAYHGGHIDFAGGKRVAWIYDITVPRQREGQLAEQERQFRKILDYCPTGSNVVDEDGCLLFHNARIRELLGYAKGEVDLFDASRFWRDLDQRAAMIDKLRKGGQVLNQEVLWKTSQDDLRGDPEDICSDRVLLTLTRRRHQPYASTCCHWPSGASYSAGFDANVIVWRAPYVF
jgi:PAS domain-containing protein